MRFETWKMTRIAVLSAVAIVLFFVEIPVVAFYKLDISTFPAIIAGFSMGPLAGAIVLLIKDLLHLTATSTAGVGELADFIMSLAFVLPASMLYARNKTRRSALIGLVVGTVCISVVGALTNYFVLLPFYSTVMPMEAIMNVAKKAVSSIENTLQLVLYITLPFNLLKGVVLSAVTFLTYKQVSPLLRPGAH